MGIFNQKFFNEGNWELERDEEDCDHILEEFFEKKSEKEHCGDKVVTCTKCKKEISRTPIHEHDYLVTDQAASTDYQCINCDYEYEEVKNPFG